MTWSIDASGARGAISATRAMASDIDAVADTVAERYAAAADTVQRAPRTAQALTEVAADPFLVSLASASRHVTESSDVADAVITVYESGDLQMAAETQARMPGDDS